MKKYEFQILRYYHDVVTNEFLNVGIVFFVPEENYISSKTIENANRISAIFHGVDSRFVLKSIHGISNWLNEKAPELLSSFEKTNYSTLSSLTKKVLPPNDSSIKFSETISGVTANPERTFEDLYDRFIKRYESHHESKSRNDQDAWSEYKQYFEYYKINDKIQKPDIKIKTKSDEFEFDHAWKNGVWNLFKPVSFDLSDEINIKEKIYKFAGMTEELLTSESKFNLNYLALSPKLESDHNLTQLINQKLNRHSKKINVKIIFENEASNFVKQLTEEINTHDSIEKETLED
jgi:hypothetical protein